MNETPKEEIQRILDLQRSSYLAEGVVTNAVRNERIERAVNVLKTHETRLVEAMSADFGHRGSQRNLLGEEVFNGAIDVYFQEWKYKHPSPWDFFNTIELDAGGIILTVPAISLRNADTAAVVAWWARFMELYREFRGRDADVGALMRDRGFASE